MLSITITEQHQRPRYLLNYAIDGRPVKPHSTLMAADSEQGIQWRIETAKKMCGGEVEVTDERCKACHRETPEEYREPVPGGYFCRNCVEDWAEDGE
jgi:hypothetical protein